MFSCILNRAWNINQFWYKNNWLFKKKIWNVFCCLFSNQKELNFAALLLMVVEKITKLGQREGGVWFKFGSKYGIQTCLLIPNNNKEGSVWFSGHININNNNNYYFLAVPGDSHTPPCGWHYLISHPQGVLMLGGITYQAYSIWNAYSLCWRCIIGCITEGWKICKWKSLQSCLWGIRIV